MKRFQWEVKLSEVSIEGEESLIAMRQGEEPTESAARLAMELATSHLFTHKAHCRLWSPSYVAVGADPVELVLSASLRDRKPESSRMEVDALDKALYGS